MNKLSKIASVAFALLVNHSSSAQWLSSTTASVYHHYAVDAISEDIVYAGGYGGSFLKSSDGGSTWKSIGIGSTDWVNAIHFEDELTGWVVASPGSANIGNILKTTDGGKTWSSVQNKYEYSSMFWPSASVGYVGSWEGLIVKTTTGGKTWAVVNVPSKSNLHKLYFVDDSYGFAVDTDHKLYRTADGGKTWDVFSHSGISAVFFHDKSNGFCVNEYGQIGRSKDGGATFTYWTSPNPDYKLHDIAFSDAFNGIAIGGLDCSNGSCTPKPAIYVTRDGGLTWANDTRHPHVGQDIGFYAIDFSPKGLPFIAGSDHIMLRNAQFTDITTVTNENNDHITVYPNPVMSSLNIVDKNSAMNGQELILTNCLGVVVKTWTMDNKNASVDVKDLAHGIYTLTNQHKTFSHKIIKD